MTLKGMEYKDRSGDNKLIEKLVNDQAWVMQQKFDGTRAMIHLSDLSVTQRNGKELKHTAATQWLSAIRAELKKVFLHSPGSRLVLDCELIIETGEVYVFDVIDTENLDRPLALRLKDLWLLPLNFNKIRRVNTAVSPAEKRKLLESCAGTEGVVAKNIHAPYQSGIRTGDVLKLKNTHTADLVVLSLSTEPLSAGLGFISHGGAPITISRASMIGKDATIRVGDVVEVNYLAWTGASLLQPRIIKKRWDKDPEACNFKQLAPYSRKPVTF